MTKLEMQGQLAGIWSSVVGFEVGVDDDLFLDLGVDSLQAMRAIEQIRQFAACDVSPDVLIECPTVAKQVEHILSSELAKPSQLITLHESSGGPSLLLMHPAGYDAFAYLPLVRAIDPRVGVYVFQNKFRTRIGEMYGSIEEMAAEYAALAQTLRLEGPLLVGGWSLGGVVAFEVARRLSAEVEVAELLLFDAWLPAFAPESRAVLGGSSAKRLAALYRAAGKSPEGARRSRRFGRELEQLRRLDPLERFGEFYSRLLELDVHNAETLLPLVFADLPGFPDGVGSDWRTRWLTAFDFVCAQSEVDSDFERRVRLDISRNPWVRKGEELILARYHPAGRYSGQVTHFVVRGSGAYQGWSELCVRPPQVVELDIQAVAPADAHASMMNDVNAGEIARALSERIERHLAPVIGVNSGGHRESG